MSRKEINIGNSVACDWCNKDFTDSNKSGGFMFSGYATCPDCAEEKERTIKEYGEEQYITARCPKDKSFADWIRDDIRNGENGQIIISDF
jgi:hypothetical protein